MKTTMFRLLPAILLAALVAGCGPGRNYNSVQTATVFTKDDPDAIIIMGVNSISTQKGLLTGAYYPDFTMTWTTFHAKGAESNPKGYFTISFDRTSAAEGKPVSENAQYRIFRVSPGAYYLINTTHQDGNTTYRTLYTRESGMPVIRVSAGEVVYAGEFEYQVIGNPQLKGIRRNDPRAKQAIGEYGLIEPAPVFRAPKLYKKVGEPGLTIPGEDKGSK